MDRREFLAATAAAGLAAGLLGIGQARADTSRRAVSGSVLGGGKPLGGVLVSDGCRVVRTSADGRYELSIGPDSGPFVFVTTPRGYWTEDFHQPLAAAAKTGRAEFSLRPMEQADRFDFVFITDMHLEAGRRWGIPKSLASIREIDALRPAPAFLWTQGDISLQSNAGKEYGEFLKLAKMPVRNGVGNHEMQTDRDDPREEFHRLFGPGYYSFDWGPVHCIMLDGNRIVPGKKGYGSQIGMVDGSELAWLRADLAAQPPGKTIIAGIHIPIVSTFPERHRNIPDDAPYCRVANHAALTELFAQHHVRLVLQGHMHENERATVKGVEYVESGALSGSWFRGGSGMERNVDGSPRGYRIVSVDGAKITHRYCSCCESHVDCQGEFVEIARPVAACNNAEFVFNCYDAPNGSTAQVRIDEGPLRPMPPFRPVNSEGLEKPHHFRLVADTRSLKPGRHTIEARVRWPDGTEVVRREAFVVKVGA